MEQSGSENNLPTDATCPPAIPAQYAAIGSARMAEARRYWRSGRLVLSWKHGGESELQYGWPDERA
jgi:hypothetical protein